MALPSRLTPQQRRSALEQLPRSRLNTLTEHFGLDVGDKRVVDNHVSALIGSRNLEFADVLGLLKREELQNICDALGLDRGGARRMC